jgi:transposase
MHIDIVPNRGSPPAVLLRESYREGAKVKKRTLANLSSLSASQVEAMRQVLKGRSMVPVDERFERVDSFHHGHVQAVYAAMARLGFAELLASRPSPERDRVCAMVAAQILEPASKLAYARWWGTTTIPQTFGLGGVDEDDLYGALDWLLQCQPRIEKKLARRHLKEGGLVLYDLSSSYFEGVTCPLAALGHNRDGKKGKLQVNYGLLTDSRGCPVAVSVFKGNTGDPKTLMPQVDKAKDEFNIQRLVLVGDRGMITQTQIDQMKAREDHEGIDWIAALKSGAIRKLIDSKNIQMDLFDERNLFELTSTEFPDERLIACRNPELAKLRVHKRQSLLAATQKELEKVRRMVAKGKLEGRATIGIRVGRVINKYKVAKHYKIQVDDKSLAWQLQSEKIAAETALDGLYVIRTSLEKTEMDANDAVRSYKQLGSVERAFRSLKSIDLDVRPIRHRSENRVRAHIFLCMLAYYIKWHMNEAWRPLLFCDEDQAAKKERDPVAPASRSAKALEKVTSKKLEDGEPVHSFTTLIKRLAGIVRNICHIPGAKPGATFEILTTPDKTQQRALGLVEAIRM